MNYYVSKETFYKAVIKQFKAVPGNKEITVVNKPYISNNILKGIFITNNVYEHNSGELNINIENFIINEFGINIAELNNSFLTFAAAKNMSPEEWLYHQISHYFSTYGAEALLGVSYENPYIYIPAKELDLDENEAPIKVTVFDYISDEEIRNRVEMILESGVALKKETQDDLSNIIIYLKLKIDIEACKNKEFKIRLYKLYDLVPKNGVEFLRYIIFDKFDSSLLIKNKGTILLLKNGKNYLAYFKKADLVELAKVFKRYKPIFLAIKNSIAANSELKSIINKIRRMSDTYHVPVKKKILDCITSNENIDIDELKKELNNVTTFKKVSLLNALLFRLNNPKFIAYFIRNGKAFVKDYKGESHNKKLVKVILDSIIEDIRPNIECKSIYLPDDIVYAAPTSEKLFWGNIPFNSYKELEKNIIIGVHWFDHISRTDLDLSLVSEKYHHTWYNSYEKQSINDIIFSGDMTAAPKPLGAVEAYYISDKVKTDELIQLNLNLYSGIAPVDFKLFFGNDMNISNKEFHKLEKKNIIKMNEICSCLKNSIANNSMFLGFLDVQDENKKFIFTHASMGNEIITRKDDVSLSMNSAMRTKFESCLKLKDLLILAGAKFTKEDDADWDINLDPQSVTKDVFISLLTKA